MISVHGRTKRQGYQGNANWDAIAEVKQNVKIPVLAIGDVNSMADIQKILSITNCDGVMIGRSALRNPWIFAKQDLNQVTLKEKLDLLADHLDLMINFYGLDSGLILFRKYIKFYLDVSTLGKELRSEIYNQKDPFKLKIALFDIANT
jgi:tRNA-dihydrouridine synthase